MDNGDRFGKLTVVGFSHNSDKGKVYLCTCDCGNSTTALGSCLKGGTRKTCGCFHRRHGMYKTSEYGIWHSMKSRCDDKKCKYYKNYGARGIKYVKRWSKFENFIQDMGVKPTPKHSLDRIDNNKGYSKSNCRWATPDEQHNNKRNSRIIEHLGKRLTCAQWSRMLGVARWVVHGHCIKRKQPISVLINRLTPKTQQHD